MDSFEMIKVWRSGTPGHDQKHSQVYPLIAIMSSRSNNIVQLSVRKRACQIMKSDVIFVSRLQDAYITCALFNKGSLYYAGLNIR